MAFVGIDFGRSTCMVATCGSEGPRVLKDERGNEIVESYVGIDPKTNKFVVGDKAKQITQSSSDNVVERIRRLMGKDTKIAFGAGETEDQVLSPEEVAAHLFRRLKRSAEAQLEEEVDRCVITVPANFSEPARQATRRAGKIAGMTVERIMSEPTAAILAYGFDEKVEKEHVMVYDLSKGTFGVSIVKRRGDVLDVEASSGDTDLGGKDFDEALLWHIAEMFEETHGISIEPGSSNYYGLLFACENAKKELSFNRWTSFQVSVSVKAGRGACITLDVEVTRSTFEDLISDKIDRTGALIEKALEDAELVPSEIDRIILAGGSTHAPCVQDHVEKIMGQPPRREIDPEKTVALGAAIRTATVDGKISHAKPGTVTAKQSHYEVLGVSEDASEEEIEDAFYRKVREHPPEQDPEGHERLQDAQRVLLKGQPDQGWRASNYFEDVEPLLNVSEDEISSGRVTENKKRLYSLVEEMKSALSSNKEERVEDLRADIIDILFEIRG